MPMEDWEYCHINGFADILDIVHAVTNARVVGHREEVADTTDIVETVHVLAIHLPLYLLRRCLAHAHPGCSRNY